MMPFVHDRSLPDRRVALVLFAPVVWIVLASFLPATRTPRFVLFEIPVNGYDLFIFLAAILASIGWLLAGRIPFGESWPSNLPGWFAAIVGYAALSLAWAGLDWYNTLAMCFTLILAVAAFLLPYLVLSVLSPAQIRKLVRGVALVVAAASAIYSAESILSLGLRSELGRFYSFGFGMERIKGPLYSASTGHVILLPAAAFLLEDWLTERSHRFVSTLGLLSLAVAILGLGSRSSLFVVTFFCIAAVFIARGIHGKFLTGGLLLLGISVAASVVFAQASVERFLSLHDVGRIGTHLTALRSLEARGGVGMLSGSGYGSVWPWYLPDVEYADAIARGGDFRATNFGLTLYQPHSVLLVLVVELGVFGLAFLVKLWIVLLRLFHTRGQDPLFAAGVLCASIAMFGDLYIFKNPKISALWWFYLLAALALTRQPSRERWVR